MKSAIVIPGWHTEACVKPYEDIIARLNEVGFRSRIHKPNWAVHNTAVWVDDLVNEIRHAQAPLTLLGFSMGGMIALLASMELEIDNLILCSPSGYFSEYIPLLTPDDLQWANEHLKDFDKLSSNTVLHKVKVTQGYIFAGEKELDEWQDFRQWIDDLRKQTEWKFQAIPKTGHDIESPEYQAELSTLIQELSSAPDLK